MGKNTTSIRKMISIAIRSAYNLLYNILFWKKENYIEEYEITNTSIFCLFITCWYIFLDGEIRTFKPVFMFCSVID